MVVVLLWEILKVMILVCRHLCREAKATIIAVDYKLAPELKFPAAITDTEDAIKEIINRSEEFNIDTNQSYFMW